MDCRELCTSQRGLSLDETAAEFLARGGIEWAMHYLHELERQDDMWQTS